MSNDNTSTFPEVWQGAYCKNCNCECHCSDTEREVDDREIPFINKGECYECSTGGEVCNRCEH